MQHAKELLSFIEQCPTAYQTVSTLCAILEEQGFTVLNECDPWHLCHGGKYAVTRNGSSLIAFTIPNETKNISGYHIVATHSDAPSFKLKPCFEQKAPGNALQWNVEKYGGAICSSWMDRPLSVAGRVIVADESGIGIHHVGLKQDIALIPNLAIHMNRKVNEGVPLNVQVDMLPLVGLGEQSQGLLSRIADRIGVDESNILTHDLFLYVRSEGKIWGLSNEFVSAPRLDDLMCTYAAAQAFVGGAHANVVPVLAVFDNEEIGSTSRQGAASSLLRDVLSRVDAFLACQDTFQDGFYRRLANSMAISADNAHAVHPNHPEYADNLNRPCINGGIVIKYHSEQRYATDAISGAIFKQICNKAGVKTQAFANRSDIPGGSTLGNIVVSDLPCLTVDIGLPQLAMHSAYETAGVQDLDDLLSAFKMFYHTSLCANTADEISVSFG